MSSKAILFGFCPGPAHHLQPEANMPTEATECIDTIRDERRPSAEPSRDGARIVSVEIEGGFLDGQRMVLGGDLTCLIGARGAGKTTLIELVRYALGALPNAQIDAQARRRVETLVERNLAGGRVRVNVRTREGLRYEITRSPGEEPVVLAERDGGPPLALRSAGLFAADIYSQNEVETIADTPLAQLELIDRFNAAAIVNVNRRISTVESDLRSNAAAVLPLQGSASMWKEEIAALPALEANLAALAGVPGGGGEQIDRAHVDRGRREREQRAASVADQLLAEFHKRFTGAVGHIAVRAATTFPAELTEGPNAPLMTRLSRTLLECGRDVDGLLGQAAERLERARAVISNCTGEMVSAHVEQEEAFRSLMKKQEAAQGQVAERSRLERLRNQLLAKAQSLADAEVELAELRSVRRGLLDQLSELRDERFAIREQVAARINAALNPPIRVSVEQAGNHQEYCKAIEDALKPARMRHGQVAERLSAALMPSDLVQAVRGNDAEPLIRAGINADQAQKALVAMGDPKLLLDIEAVELADLPKIELKDGEHYKDSTALSTGQKCTVILPVLLLDNDNPLLVDQPEDNLDNRFICETIVKAILATKQRRQLVFVTHNPNIPVLGDAGRVFVLDSDGSRAWVKAEGSVDECREEIVTLLEGGREAFLQRQVRYAY
jgi:ABC-type lipoprotein export system ATPase subunit